MRGAPLHFPGPQFCVRIIPADAGSTFSGLTTVLRLRDHPRGCGEHPTIKAPINILGGSSPRMRGAPNRCYRGARDKGIIPADAGSTPPTNFRWKAWPGSSPRMRGAPDQETFVMTKIGIIPADAGSTNRLRRLPARNGDHPRGCGEHPPSGLPLPSLSGSSPRMRGALGVTA